MVILTKADTSLEKDTVTAPIDLETLQNMLESIPRGEDTDKEHFGIQVKSFLLKISGFVNIFSVLLYVTVCFDCSLQSSVPIPIKGKVYWLFVLTC